MDSNGNVLLQDGNLPAFALDSASQMQVRGKNLVNVQALMRSIQGADAE